MDERLEIISEIKALSSHYRVRVMGPAEQAHWLSDYADDLSRFRLQDIRLGCTLWRRSEVKHMPTPGELIAKCEPYAIDSNRPRIAYQAPEPEKIHKTLEDFAKVKQTHEAFLEAARARKPTETQAQMAARLRASAP